jgi:hypothetical protein
MNPSFALVIGASQGRGKVLQLSDMKLPVNLLVNNAGFGASERFLGLPVES